MTIKKPTLTDAKRIISKNNQCSNLAVAWERKPRMLTGFQGYKYWQGLVVVSADGFRARTMSISKDHDSIMVR